MSGIRHTKPVAFYDEFVRKGKGQKTTHYCPGCGHGVAHKLIAEAISDFGVQDRAVFCSPVGCSVFAYFYFDCGNIQCAHGRAPSVATGIKRTREDAIVISYQGDGDLAGIGAGSIVHAANRGENITVFFINNAIYGMTGGQMAPTTLIGQQTTTTPTGRSEANDGPPIMVSEMLSALKAPVYIERVSLGDAGRVLKARKAVRKALRNQIDGKGFSLVEILAPCPINWKMTPVVAREWIKDSLEPVFPLGCFKERAVEEAPGRERHPASDDQLLATLGIDGGTEQDEATESNGVEEQFVKLCGFGGQGIMSAGVLLANCAIGKGLNATWLPSYGPEMRGGTAYASVVISPELIGTPTVDTPNVLFCMNGPSLDAFENTVPAGGLLLINASLVDRKTTRDDVRAIYVPASDIAKELGAMAVANIVMLAVYASLTDVIDVAVLRRMIPRSIRKKHLVDVNLRAVDAGVAFCESL